jgi:hypothetical protein
MDTPPKENVAVVDNEIPVEKIAMVQIIMSFKDFTSPVAMQSISDAALQRKKELEE